MSVGQWDFSPLGYREWPINSMRWIEGNQDNCHVQANQPIVDVQAMSVVDAQIPFTFYTIDQYHNLLWMRERTTSNPSPSGAYTVVTIVPGNYTSQTIGPALLTAFAAGGLTGTYTVTFNQSTGTLSIASINRYFDLLFANNKYAYQCTVPIGFDPYTQTNIINVQSITTPHAISLSGPSCLLLRGTLGLGTGDSMVLCDDGELANIGGILCQIPVNCSPGNTITYQNTATRGGFFGCSSSVLRDGWFNITSGDDDMPILLNGGAFTFRLGLLVKSHEAQSNNNFGYGATSSFGGPRGAIR